MSGPLRKKKDHSRANVPIEWQLECGNDDIYGEQPIDEAVKHRLSQVKSQQHRLERRVKAKKKVLGIQWNA